MSDSRSSVSLAKEALDEARIIIHRLILHHDVWCDKEARIGNCDDSDVTGVPAARLWLTKYGVRHE